MRVSIPARQRTWGSRSRTSSAAMLASSGMMVARFCWLSLILSCITSNKGIAGAIT